MMNSVGTTASLPHNSWNGAWLFICFTIFRYAQNVAGIRSSQSSRYTLHIFARPFSSILLNASTVSLACG